MRRAARASVLGAGALCAAAAVVVSAVGDRSPTARALGQVVVLGGAAPLVAVGLPSGAGARAEARGGAWWQAIRRLTSPVVAVSTLVAVLVASWSPALADPSSVSPWADLTVGVVLLAVAVVAWIDPCGPWPALRSGEPGRIATLLALALAPLAGGVAIAAWAEPVGSVIGPWTIDADAAVDTAVAVLVLGGAAVPAAAAVVVLVRWIRSGGLAAAKPLVLSSPRPLTTEHVERELRRLGPARREPPR